MQTINPLSSRLQISMTLQPFSFFLFLFFIFFSFLFFALIEREKGIFNIEAIREKESVVESLGFAKRSLFLSFDWSTWIQRDKNY